MANEPRIMSDPYRKFEKDETPKLIRLAADMNKLHADMGGRDNRPERVALVKCMQILRAEIERAQKQHLAEFQARKETP